jgi:hypothetical protein
MAAERRTVPEGVEYDETRRAAAPGVHPNGYRVLRPIDGGERRDARETGVDERLEVEIPRAYNLTRDRIRMGPVVAGVFTAITSTLMLGLLGLAWSLTVANTTTPLQGPVFPSGMGAGSAIWGAIAGVIAFFLGGYVAGWSAAAFGRKWGALNGAMVFVIGVPAMLWLAGSGLGVAMGNLGTLAAAITLPGNVDLGPSDLARAANGIRNGAWWTFLGLLLALGAAAAGGSAGTRRTVFVDTGERVELKTT